MASFPSAAMSGLYKAGTAGASRHKTTSYRHLKNDDMKLLVGILSGVPFPPTSEADKEHAKAVEKAIMKLPYHLCSSSISYVFSTEDKDTGKVKPDSLCVLHKGMNASLVYSIWGWVQHELDNAIGPFLYPVLITGGLTKPQEWAARQLEPVLRMYRPEFTSEGATPIDFEPVPTHKWWFQQNACPACKLARIGSDAPALAALVSGVVGRSSSRHVGQRDKVKSKRVAMLKYWLQLHPDGDEQFEQAWELGDELQRRHKAWKKRGYALKNEVSSVVHNDLSSKDNLACRPYSSYRPVPPPAPSNTSPTQSNQGSIIDIDISEPFIPAAHACPPHRTAPAKYPASSIYSQETCAHNGYTVATGSPFPRVKTVQRSKANLTLADPSIRSETGRYSLASSFNFPLTPTDADADSLQPAPHSREVTREERLLPQRERVSMYSGYGGLSDVRALCDGGSELDLPTRERYDVSPPDTSIDGGIDREGKARLGSDLSWPGTTEVVPVLMRRTRWGELY